MKAHPTAMLLLLLFAFSCGDAGTPVMIDTRHDQCHYCRMTISNPRLALQLIDPGEEPRLFDDIGCAVSELRGEPGAPSRERRIFLADLETGAWIPREEAVLERCTNVETPMSSHLVARRTRSGEARCVVTSWEEINR